MASFADRTSRNSASESVSSFPDLAPALPPSLRIATPQSSEATHNTPQITRVESVSDNAPPPQVYHRVSSLPDRTQQAAQDSPIEMSSTRSSEELDVEQTAVPSVRPETTQTTARPSPPSSRNNSDSSSSFARVGLNYARREFSPSDHRDREKPFVCTSTTRLTSSSPDYPPPNTARRYLFGRQSWRLWRLAVGEFVATAILCALYVASLVYYGRKEVMYPDNQAWFNAISQGIAFLLGVGIAASFRSYAKLLRWRILALTYRPIETFDLVLACDSLANVFKLLLKAGRRETDERRRFKKYLPSQTQMCCVCWIALKVTVLFLVGYAGSLTNLDGGESYVSKYQGQVNITDLTSLKDMKNDASLSRMQTWASRGIRHTGTLGLDYPTAKLSMFSTLNNGTSAYWPKVFDPLDYSNRAVSYRQIRADTLCTSYDVVGGQFGNESTITYIGDEGVPTVFSFPEFTIPGPGGLLASSHIKSTCGPRCVNIEAFLAQTEPGAPIVKLGRQKIITYDTARFFKCNNTVGPVLLYDGKGSLSPATGDLSLDDSWAQMVAGAVGWEDEGTSEDVDDTGHSGDDLRSTPMFTSYPASSELGTFLALNFSQTLNSTNMAHVISSMSMVGLAAADDSTVGLQYFQNLTWNKPMRSQHLQVDVPTAAGVLGSVVFGQFVAMIFVFVFANGAIIKDDSPISIAKLYYSLLHQHGFADVGCLLKGEEIIEKMGDCDVTYGWTVGKGERNGREIRHLDVFERDVDDEERQVSGNFKDGNVYYYD